MKKIIYILAAFQILITSNSFSQSGWVWQNPLPQGNDLFGLKMFDANSGICINSDNILKTSNGGLNWNLFYNGIPSENKSISMVSQNMGYLLADSVTVLKTLDGGSNWTRLPGNSPFKNGSLYFINELTGFAYAKVDTKQYSVNILKTTNGALSWNYVYTDTTFFVSSVQFINNNTGYATGVQFLYTILGDYKAKFLYTHNGGASWDTLQNTIKWQNSNLYFLNELTGYLYGYYSQSSIPRIFKTTNSGINWTAITYPNGAAQIQFIDNLNGYLLLGSDLYQTTNGGTNWIKHPIIINGTSVTYISGMFFSNLSTCYAVGSGGKIIKTTNSGLNWEFQSNNYLNDQYNQTLWDVQFADNNTGFTIADYGKMLRTTNGGTNWELRQFDSGLDFSAIAKVNSNVWYMATWWEGKILKTTNTGQSWDTSYPNVYGPTRLEFINEQTGFGICKYNNFIKTTNGGVNWAVTSPFGGFNYAMDFIDENTGFVCGSLGKLDKTTNGGITWTRYFPLPYDYDAKDIQFVNYNTGYIACVTGYENQENGVLKTTNGGINWFHCMSGSTFIYDIYFVNENTGFALNHSQLYKTINAGNNWYQIRTCAYYTLWVTYFTDSLTGWIVGSNGTIIKTTNGGGTPIGIITNTSEIPNKYKLSQNYPNPFNPTTIISYSIPKSSFITIKVYDLLGRFVKLLVNENKSPGNYSVNFDGSNYASGVYFYSIETDMLTQTKKMVLLK